MDRRALWPLSGRRPAGCLVGPCRVPGRDPRGSGADRRLARSAPRLASVAHPQHGHGACARAGAAASWRCAGLVALGHTRRCGCFFASLSTARRGVDGNRGLAQSVSRLRPSRRAFVVGQCPHEPAFSPLGPALVGLVPARLCSLARCLGPKRHRCTAPARGGCPRAGGAGQPQV